MQVKVITIDVREPAEYAESHVSGAVNIPLSAFEQSVPDTLSKFSLDQLIIVYCNSGRRSELVKNVMQSHGFKKVINGISVENTKSLIKNYDAS
jgi:phage shock protein E